MDKKTILALVIIGAILFGFTWYSNRQQKRMLQEKATADSIWRANNPLSQTPEPVLGAATADSLPTAATSAKADSIMTAHIGSQLMEARGGKETFYTLENDRIKVTLSSLGGRVASVELKEYKRYGGAPLVLFPEVSSKFDAQFFIRNRYGDTQINTGGYNFSTDAPAATIVTADEASVTLRLQMDSTAWVDYVYTLPKDGYMMAFRMNFIGMERLLSNQSYMAIDWETIGNQNEKGFDNENTYSDLAYMAPGTKGDMEKLGLSKGTKEETVNHSIKWIAFKQQFFSSVFVAQESFERADLRYDTYTPGSGMVKKYSAKITVPFTAQTASREFSYYFGPNKYSVLKKYDQGFEKLVPLGWGIFGWINRYLVIPVFDWLSSSIASFGLIILILTVLIKLLIAPLTYKSYLSTAKMRLLKPEMDELAAKYPKQEDMAKKQQATMELYKKAGVNPMGGCLPMLIQFPFLIAMFRFFPAAIELRQESFLWADDLSSYDSILDLPFNIPFYGSHVSLFALLMAVTVYFSTRISMAQTMQSGPQMAGMKFMSLYLMPVMMLFWFNNYSSALSYYYFLSSVITIIQTYAFRYAVDDKKLHAQMKENAKKPKKKSKWAERYEEMIKEQQRQQRAGNPRKK